MANISDMTADEARRWARTGILASFALVLTYVETFIPLPIPIPGAKLGLANIAILVAFQTVGVRGAFAISIIKILVSGLLFGSPVMVPYATGGTLCAFFAIAILMKVPGLSIVLVSVVGSICHIAGQLAVATLMLGSAYVWYTFPLLLVVACFTGAVTGLIALRLLDTLDAGQDDVLLLVRDAGSAPAGFSAAGRRSPCRWVPSCDARVLLLAFGAYVIAVLCIDEPIALGICLALALGAAIASSLTLRDIAMAAAPLAMILVITTLAQVAYNQQGAVLVQWGPVTVTQQAAATIAFMMVRLVCLAAMGIALVRMVPFGRLTAALAQLISPLRYLGVNVEVFALTLDMAVQFIPLLVADFEALRSQAVAAHPGKDGLVRKLKMYSALLGPLAQRAFSYADGQAAALMGEMHPASPNAASVRTVEAVSG